MLIYTVATLVTVYIYNLLFQYFNIFATQHHSTTTTQPPLSKLVTIAENQPIIQLKFKLDQNKIDKKSTQNQAINRKPIIYTQNQNKRKTQRRKRTKGSKEREEIFFLAK